MRSSSLSRTESPPPSGQAGVQRFGDLGSGLQVTLPESPPRSTPGQRSLLPPSPTKHQGYSRRPSRASNSAPPSGARLQSPRRLAPMPPSTSPSKLTPASSNNFHIASMAWWNCPALRPGFQPNCTRWASTSTRVCSVRRRSAWAVMDNSARRTVHRSKVGLMPDSSSLLIYHTIPK